MDIADAIRSIRIFDLLVALFLAGFFVLGYIQGSIRRLLGLGSLVFAFLVAAQLREPLGNFLKANWTQYEPEYSVMIGFGLVFVTIAILSTIAIQSFYKKVTIFEEHPIVDEILGGILGLIQGAFLLAVLFIVLDSFFELPGIAERPNELPLLRGIHDAYDDSATAAAFRNSIIPAFLAITGPFIPEELRVFFAR